MRHGIRHSQASELSDIGSSYISGDLSDWLGDYGMDHIRGAPSHPKTQGKIERRHQTLKNCILLENYYLPGAMEQAVGAFIVQYNHVRCQENVGNFTPAGAYSGRAPAILEERTCIKTKTLKQRRLLNQTRAA